MNAEAVMLRSTQFYKEVLLQMRLADRELKPDEYRRVLEDTIEALSICWRKLAERRTTEAQSHRERLKAEG